MVFCAQLGHKLYRLPTAHLICFINMSVCPDVRLSVVCPSVCLSVRRWGFVCAQLLYKLARSLLTAPGCEPPASSYKLPTAASDRLHTLALDPSPTIPASYAESWIYFLHLKVDIVHAAGDGMLGYAGIRLLLRPLRCSRALGTPRAVLSYQTAVNQFTIHPATHHVDWGRGLSRIHY